MKEIVIWQSPREDYRILEQSGEDGALLLHWDVGTKSVVPGRLASPGCRFMVDKMFRFQRYRFQRYRFKWVDLSITNSLDDNWIVNLIDSGIHIPAKDNTTKGSLEMFRHILLLRANKVAVNEQTQQDKG
jgi:hypothetical protein